MTAAALRALAILCIAALTLSATPAAALASATAAGNAQGAWVVALPRIGGAVLVHLDASAPLAARIVTRLPVAPVALAAGDRAVIAAFPTERIGDAELRPFRIASLAVGPSGVEVFTPLEPLPPLPSGAPLSGLIVADGIIAALTIAPAALWTCDGDTWTAVALPDAALTAESLWLVPAQGRIGLCAADRAGTASLSTIPARGPSESRAWSTERIALPPGTRDLVSVASQLIAAHPSTDGAATTISLIRPTDWMDRASVPLGAAPPVVTAIGDRILLITPGDTDPLRTTARVYGLDGSLAAEGPIDAASPLTPQDLQIVVFGVMGVVVAAMLFALRAEGAPTIALPDGAVIAPPLRRLCASAIDLLPGLAAAVVAFLAPTTDAAPTETLPTAIAIGFFTTLILSAVPEAIFARTLGKWALGLRTISLTGVKPSWAQALGRTLSKLVFPPLGLLILLHPTVPPPGSCGTIVVMNRPPDADPTPPTDRRPPQ